MMDIGIWEVCYFLENLSKKQGLMNQVENDHLTSPSQPQWKNSRKVTSERKKVILASRLPARSQALLSLISVDVKGEEPQGAL